MRDERNVFYDTGKKQICDTMILLQTHHALGVRAET